MPLIRNELEKDVLKGQLLAVDLEEREARLDDAACYIMSQIAIGKGFGYQRSYTLRTGYLPRHRYSVDGREEVADMVYPRELPDLQMDDG